jgi:hypothetical protein
MVLGLAALIGISGCDNSSDPVSLTPVDAQSNVEGSMPAALEAVPSVDAASQLALGVMSRLTAGNGAMSPITTAGQQEPSHVPLGPGTVQAAIPAVYCPPTFDLGNGISGTCTMSESGTITVTFGGTMSLTPQPMSVEGTAVATPAAEQPPAGMRYDLNVNATTSGPNGSATWNLTGFVLVGETGQIADYRLTSSHTVTPSGGASTVVTAVVSPGAVEMVLTGPRGGVVRFLFNRTAWSGTVSVNGLSVAMVTIADGCASIDYLNPTLADRTICSEPQG